MSNRVVRLLVFLPLASALVPPQDVQLFQRLQSTLLDRVNEVGQVNRLSSSTFTFPDIREIFSQGLSSLPKLPDIDIDLQLVLPRAQFESVNADVLKLVDETRAVLTANPFFVAPLAQLALFAIVVAAAAQRREANANAAFSSEEFPIASRSISSSSTSVYSVSGVYNPDEAKKYFSERPLLYATRAFELASSGVLFALSILSDVSRGSEIVRENEATRAKDLTALLVRLGPTFIKIGQSLSIRTDLLRPAYLKALSQLQDDVPPFPSSEAVSIIESELGGRSISSVFGSSITPSTTVIAAASLGQVYKATLTTGETVAVKVQRPRIEELIALDMHILRSIAVPAKDIFKLNTDLVGIVDEWGKGFVKEVDYRQEAANSEAFMAAIAATPLDGKVFSPPVISNASTRRILTTAWVDGDRLEVIPKDEQRAALKLSMLAYLTMMLETPLLHADPHPGNLRRTADNRLCILDWGLITELEPDLQGAMIQHVAHLTSRDYERVPGDLVRLGFIAAGKEASATESGVVEVLAGVYSRWAMGGGAAKIDVAAVVSDLQKLSRDYGNIFQVPPYFSYIAKAFGVIEGIGLVTDPDYAIVGECMPYIAQRLLTRCDAASGAALRSFVYGADAEDEAVQRVVAADRVELLFRGIESYSKTREAGAGAGAGKASNAPLTAGEIEGLANSVIEVLLAPPPVSLPSAAGSGVVLRETVTPCQALLIEESAKLVGALARSQFSALRRASGPLNLGLGRGGRSGVDSQDLTAENKPQESSPRSLLGVFLDPLGLFSGSRLIEADEMDRKVIGQVSRVLQAVQAVSNGAESVDANASPAPFSLRNVRDSVSPILSTLGALSPRDRGQLVQSLAAKLWAKREHAVVLGNEFVREVVTQTSQRVGVGANR